MIILTVTPGLKRLLTDIREKEQLITQLKLPVIAQDDIISTADSTGENPVKYPESMPCGAD